VSNYGARVELADINRHVVVPPRIKRELGGDGGRPRELPTGGPESLFLFVIFELPMPVLYWLDENARTQKGVHSVVHGIKSAGMTKGRTLAVLSITEM